MDSALLTTAPRDQGQETEMQVSIQQVASLVAGRNDCLTKALFAVIGEDIDSQSRVLTQSEADAIAAHIDAQHSDATPESFSSVAEMIGESAVEMSYNSRRECGAAAQAAAEIFRMSGLHTPSVWAE